MNEQPICPLCGRCDMLEKASTIYLLGMGLKQDQSSVNGAGAWLADLSENQRKQLGRRLAPPSGGRAAPTRPLHPDLVVLTFSLVIPIFLWGIWNSQPGMRLPALIVLAAFYAGYFWKRRSLIQRFERQQAERQAAVARVQHSIERWMCLYYCACEDVVFVPGEEAVPADQMPGYLLQEQPES